MCVCVCMSLRKYHITTFCNTHIISFYLFIFIFFCQRVQGSASRFYKDYCIAHYLERCSHTHTHIHRVNLTIYLDVQSNEEVVHGVSKENWSLKRVHAVTIYVELCGTFDSIILFLINSYYLYTNPYLKVNIKYSTIYDICKMHLIYLQIQFIRQNGNDVNCGRRRTWR